MNKTNMEKALDGLREFAKNMVNPRGENDADSSGEAKIRATEFLCLFAVSILGTFNGAAYELVPKLPAIFSEHVDLDGYACDARLTKVETGEGGIVCWFSLNGGRAFAMPLHDLLRCNQFLYTSIVTHIFDLIKI